MPNEPKFPPSPESWNGFAGPDERDENLDVSLFGDRWTGADILKLKDLSAKVFEFTSPLEKKVNSRILKVIKEIFPGLNENGVINLSIKYVIINAKISKMASPRPQDLPRELPPKQYARLLQALAEEFKVL